MAGFDQAEFDRDRERITSSLRRYNLHKDQTFMNTLTAYLDQLQVEGNWINQGYAPDPNWAGQGQVDDLIRQFDRKHAFHVPADWWREHRNDRGFREARAAKAQEAAQHGYLWSKTEPGPAAKRAAAAQGLILETSVPGKLFDGKNFGFQNWSDSPTMGKLWENFSTHYVDGLDGPVRALVLDGIVDNSVLTRLEWPRLRERIEAGEVPPLQVSVMNIVGDRSDSRSWTLETVANIDVHSQQSFDNLPRPTAPDYWPTQARWHVRQRAEAGNSSDSASSGSSDEYSLHNFHQVFDNPNTIVILSDPTAGPPQISASPQQLSRVVTNQLSRTASDEALPGRASPGSAGEQSGANLLASVTLDSKLTALQEAQNRRGSDSGSSGRSAPAVAAQDPYDVSQLASALPGPGMAPATPGSGYFPSDVAVSSVRQALADQASAAGNYYPASPVSSAQSYNPGQDGNVNRTPSTASSDYSGASLERVERVPSDPPAESRHHGSSSKSHKEKKHQEPPGWMKWMAGAGPSNHKPKPGKK